MLVILILLSSIIAPVFAEELDGDEKYAKFQRTAEDYRQLMEFSYANLQKRNAEREAAEARFAKTHVWKGNSRKARQNRTWRAEIERRAKKASIEAEKARVAYKINEERHYQGQMEADDHKKKADAAREAARKAQDAAEAQRLQEEAAENEKLRQQKEEEAAAEKAAAKVEVKKIETEQENIQATIAAAREDQKRWKEHADKVKAMADESERLILQTRLKGFRGSP